MFCIIYILYIYIIYIYYLCIYIIYNSLQISDSKIFLGIFQDVYVYLQIRITKINDISTLLFFFLWSNRITKLILTGSLPHGSVALKSFCLLFYFYHCRIWLWGVGVEKRKGWFWNIFYAAAFLLSSSKILRLCLCRWTEVLWITQEKRGGEMDWRQNFSFFICL